MVYIIHIDKGLKKHLKNSSIIKVSRIFRNSRNLYFKAQGAICLLYSFDLN